MSENKKPRLCEVLGVEVGEEFGWKTFGKEVPCYVDQNGELWCQGERDLTILPLTMMINYPDCIIHKPRLTEPELAICKALGAKWVTRDTRGTNVPHLWDSKPAEINGNYCNGPTAINLATVSESLFPSVCPGDCINVEEAEADMEAAREKWA